MVLMSLVEEKTEEIGKTVMDFLEIIHGEGAYEIRFIPVDRALGKSISIMKYGNDIYSNNSKGVKVRVCDASPKSVGDCLNGSLMHAGWTGVTFTVNSPDFDQMKSCTATNEHIKTGKINAQFVDIDAPKELRLNAELLRLWKRETKHRILNFGLRPAIVVETKNGYHVYWLLDNGQYNSFKYIQMQLVQYFNGDKNCINESRVLRLPYFKHLKNINEPFMVKPQFSELKNRYTQEEMKNALPELEEDILKKILRETGEFDLSGISSVRKGDIIGLITTRIPEKIVNQYQNKITMHCCMPEHEDRNPSAFINTDCMWYHCSGCGTSMKLRELVEELGWKDIIDVWDKYDIDILEEIEKIHKLMVDVEDLQHLTMTVEEELQVIHITGKVIEQLNTYEQTPNERHKKYLRDIAQVLLKAYKDKPYLIPLDMGGGKSLLIEIYLQVMMKRNNDFGAVVVLGRIEDVKEIVEKLNKAIGYQVAYPLYGFDKQECLLNSRKGKDFNRCPASMGKTCPFTKECRYWTQNSEQENYPIVVMTSARLNLKHDSLDTYNSYNKKGNESEKIGKREMLIIDEKPKLTKVETLNLKGFNLFTGSILEKLEGFDFNGKLKAYSEFKNLVDKVKPIYRFDAVGREIFEPLDSNFGLTEVFWKDFNSIYDYHDDAFKIPEILESIVRTGGHLEEIDNEKVSITTSTTIPYTKFGKYKTVIFDGTADIDIEYQHEKFHVINLEPIRTYEGLTFFKCNQINGSKTSMQSEDKLQAFIKDVKAIADENPEEIIFVPVFKDNKSYIEEYLQEYIDSNRVIVAHYGSTRGSNKYKDCSIIVLGGILHKTENYYIGKANAMYVTMGEILEDISSSNFGKMRRFNDHNIELIKLLDMLVDYSQEIKRSSQRDNSSNVKGKVYIFHNDEILLDIIGFKFPGSKIEKWSPKHIVEDYIFGKNNNKSVQAVCYFLKSSAEEAIYFTDIREAVGLSPQAFSNTLKNPYVIAFLEANGFEERKDGSKKFFMKVS
ncbi:hypothetical protein MKY15_11670 [Sporosarcina sp. FSL K6-1540]|uniref:DNA-primase RepB domain-containing protein n=1 Tax=Sporosarcina sp. FSL K6-1540 TaxID=2921555 RepID=UPI00315B3404